MASDAAEDSATAADGAEATAAEDAQPPQQHLVRVSNMEDVSVDSVTEYLNGKLGVDSVLSVEVVTPKRGRPHAVATLVSGAKQQLAVDMHKDNDWRRDVQVAVEKPSRAKKARQKQKEEAEGDAEDAVEAPQVAVEPQEREGRVRTLDKDNEEGFIAPKASDKPQGKKKQPRAPRALHFSFAGDAELAEQLKVGTPVTFRVKGTEAVDVKVKEAALEEQDGKKEQQQAAEGEVEGEEGPKRRQVKCKPVSFYARGPPNDSSKYRGFGEREWRGKPSVNGVQVVALKAN